MAIITLIAGVTWMIESLHMEIILALLSTHLMEFKEENHFCSFIY